MKPLKDHELRQLVNDLTECARLHHKSQSLRCRLSRIVHDALDGIRVGTKTIDSLGFRIEPRSGIDVLVYDDESCHPASSEEVDLWDLVTKDL